MDAGRIAWVVGAYLGGTFPSAWLVAKATRARVVQEKAGRRAGETDPHVLMVKDLGPGWAALATSADVAKAVVIVLAARHAGNLPPDWLAAVAVAVVLGHTFPPFLGRWAGRGLAAAAGAFLVLLPLEMAIAGALILLGFVMHTTGLASTLAMAAVPALAAFQHQPAAFVWMAAAIFAILIVRRLEGVGDVVAAGTPWPRALLWRAVLDTSAPAVPERKPSSG